NKNFPQPVIVKALQEFLGILNFYHHFVPRAAELMFPLYEAIKGEVAKYALDWTEERSKAFESMKSALANATLLAHPRSDALTALTTDVSGFVVEAVHEQLVDGIWQPLAFFQYSMFDSELLSLYLVAGHFCFLLESCSFHAS
ncbi:hypothetical protein LDENG_00247100, partial [Lucifuga dentata]